jgi:PHD/YefM family antitoxin component YafN of YafNO toxin-antitoxin module
MPNSATLQDVYETLKRIEEKMISREDVEALIDTVEILSNPETMRAIRRNDRDIQAGRVREVSSSLRIFP